MQMLKVQRFTVTAAQLPISLLSNLFKNKNFVVLVLFSKRANKLRTHLRY